MPSWRPLPRIAFAICIYPFQPSSPADLPLEIGDELYIIEQGGHDGSWYRGYLVAPPSLLAGLTSSKGQTLEARVFSGIFPRVCVEVREVLGDSKDTSSPQDAVHDAPRPANYPQPTNGVVTPTESTRTTSPFTKGSGSGSHARGSSKSDAAPVLPGSLPRPQSSRRSTRKRAGSTHSQWTAREEHLQQLALPLSPISDPTAPRPPAPVPMLKIGDETPTSAQEPLVDEIASCLREWHSTKVHELLLARKYGSLEKMSKLVNTLDTARRQLLHKVLTAKELEKVREETVWDLVAGNKMLCGDVIVRSPSQRGRILTGDDSAIDIIKLQSMMSLLESRPTPHIDEHNLHHLFVSLKHVAGDVVPGAAQLCMHLCLKTPGLPLEPLSESYSFDLTGKDGLPVSLAGDKLRALLVDLSLTDIGEGAGSGSTLYLVFKLTTNEPLRSSSAGDKSASSRETTPGKISGVQPSQQGSIKGGRRSVMFGGSKRKESINSRQQTDSSEEHRNQSFDQSRSQTGDARPGSAATATTRSRALSRDQKTLKRTVAVGVVPVNQVLQSCSEADRTIAMFSTAAPGEDVSEDGGDWDSILPEIFPSSSGQYTRDPQISRITIHLKAFAETDAERLIQKVPTMLHNIKQCRKIGFSGAPTKPRSDIYLTLVEPFLPKNAFLAHPKTGSVPLGHASSMNNLQLTIEVRKSSGERIEGCIYPCANSAGHTAWRTTAAQRGEGWNSTIRLAIDPQDVPGSHLVMSVADAPGFPFALCWMPLWNQDAFVRDGDHALTLYKYDEYTSGMIAGKGAYLGLPWCAKKKDEHVMGPMAAVQVKTFLCSTKYSQDPTILGLIKWQEQPPGELVGLLRRFNFVPEIEIVKLLSEVFDALFAIQSHYAGSDEYEDLVFNAVVIVLGIVYDRRFNLEPLVDHYARTKVFHSLVTSCLLQSLGRLLAKPTDTDSSRRLRATFKVGKLIMKFLVNARERQKAKEESIGIKDRTQFSKDMKVLFTSLESLMKNQSPVLIGTKTILVQNLHSWIPELDGCMPATEVFKLTAGFIESSADVQGKLILYKLVLIHHLSELQIFRPPEVRRMLLTSTVQWLAPYWGRVDTMTDQWKDQVRLCCSVVASQVEELGKEASEYMPKLVESYRVIQATPRPAKKTLSLLFPTSYPFPSKTTTAEAHFDEAMAEISAVLAAMSSLPSLLHPEWPKEETAEFLFSVLQVYISILDCEAFPSSWLSVHIYHHKATMRALEKLFNILSDSFLPLPDDADAFSTELWRAFFDALLKLVGSDALALETFPEQKRRAVWKIAGDVREHGADLLQRSWETIGWEVSAEEKAQFGLEKMGGFQVQYVPGLVAPIVELCLSVHEGLRSVAIEVLQTMIISEWSLSEDLAAIQAEMIDCLDNLFKSKHLTEAVSQKHFIQELIELFEPLAAHDPDEPLLAALKNLISTVDELLDLLVAVHSTEATGEIFHIMDTLHLMEFLKDMQKEDMYIRYVHQLVELQADAQNYTEAGLALRLHAELYEWDPNTIVDPLTDPSMPPQSAFERKEWLYFQMIDHYENGQSWDNALAAYRELATQYEHNIFDFAKLARTQHAMAKIHESIARGERSNPRYFRVVYRGLGFPPGLRDKQFIFEGSPNDRLASFTDRMQQQHPSAHIINPGAEVDVEGQFLQIYPVSPQKDLAHPIYQRAKVSQSVKDYYLLSRPSHFTSASRRSPSTANAREATAEKSLYTTAESFPTILRRSEIVAVGTVTLTPLQMAIERTSRKTVELLAIEKRITDGDDTAFNLLTQELMYAVDTNSRDCVANYHDLLPPLEDAGKDPDDETYQLNPLENAMRVALIDYALIIRRCLSLYVRPAQQATKADLSQRFESAYGRELSLLLPPNVAPATHAPADSWLPATTSQSQTAGPAPDEKQVNGVKVASPVQNGRPSRQDKKRSSLAVLTKEFLSREPEKDKEKEKEREKGREKDKEKEKEAKPDKSMTDDDASTTVSSRSRSKEPHNRNRLSLNFLSHTTPNSPQPEALPSFPSNGPSNMSDGNLPQQPSAPRPDTVKSQKSDKSLSSRSGSVKKRLSFMNISKKASKTSVRGRVDDTLVEE